MTRQGKKREEGATSQRYQILIAPPGRLNLRLGELWEYRELLFFFTWRDVKVKYKQAVLGVVWAVLQPLLMMTVFSVFFGRLLGVPSNGVPYPIFVYSGLMLWTLFSAGVMVGANSLVLQANMINKVYFPRMVAPISSVLVAVFDFAMVLIVYFGMIAYYGFPLTLLGMVLYLPASILVTVGSALGLAIGLSALNLLYRDFRYVVPFAVQLGFFVTPVVYPPSILGEGWIRTMMQLNPMAGAVALARAGILGVPMDVAGVATSGMVAAVLLSGGVCLFRRLEAEFADRA